MDFESVWRRIQKEAGIKNITQLSEVIGKTHQTISAKKGQQKEFPIEWAYIVGKKYGLSLDWLLTGEEPVKAGMEKVPKNRYVLLLDEWLCEIANEDPRKEYWFQCAIEKTFPEFKEWAQRKSIVGLNRRLHETVA